MGLTWVNLSRFLESRLRCTSAISLSRQADRWACWSRGCAATILSRNAVYIYHHTRAVSTVRQAPGKGQRAFLLPVPKKGMSAALYLMSVLLSFVCQHCLQALQKKACTWAHLPTFACQSS